MNKIKTFCTSIALVGLCGCTPPWIEPTTVETSSATVADEIGQLTCKVANQCGVLGPGASLPAPAPGYITTCPLPSEVAQALPEEILNKTPDVCLGSIASCVGTPIRNKHKNGWTRENPEPAGYRIGRRLLRHDLSWYKQPQYFDTANDFVLYVSSCDQALAQASEVGYGSDEFETAWKSESKRETNVATALIYGTLDLPLLDKLTNSGVDSRYLRLELLNLYQAYHNGNTVPLKFLRSAPIVAMLVTSSTVGSFKLDGDAVLNKQLEGFEASIESRLNYTQTSGVSAQEYKVLFLRPNNTSIFSEEHSDAYDWAPGALEIVEREAKSIEKSIESTPLIQGVDTHSHTVLIEGLPQSICEAEWGVQSDAENEIQTFQKFDPVETTWTDHGESQYPTCKFTVTGNQPNLAQITGDKLPLRYRLVQTFKVKQNKSNYSHNKSTEGYLSYNVRGDLIVKSAPTPEKDIFVLEGPNAIETVMTGTIRFGWEGTITFDESEVKLDRTRPLSTKIKERGSLKSAQNKSAIANARCGGKTKMPVRMELNLTDHITIDVEMAGLEKRADYDFDVSDLCIIEAELVVPTEASPGALNTYDIRLEFEMPTRRNP